MALIGYDNSAGQAITATLNITVGSGSNRGLLAYIVSSSGGTASIGAGSMTNLLSYNAGGNFYEFYWYASPPSGSNTITFSSTASSIQAVSYTGISANPVDTTTTLSSGGGAITMTTTTTKNNDWLVMGTAIPAGFLPQTLSAGAGTTNRSTVGGNSNYQLWDSNGAKSPAGSYSLIGTGANASNTVYGVMLSLKPYETPAGFFMFM